MHAAIFILCILYVVVVKYDKDKVIVAVTLLFVIILCNVSEWFFFLAKPKNRQIYDFCTSMQHHCTINMTEKWNEKKTHQQTYISDKKRRTTKTISQYFNFSLLVSKNWCTNIMWECLKGRTRLLLFYLSLLLFLNIYKYSTEMDVHRQILDIMHVFKIAYIFLSRAEYHASTTNHEPFYM